MEHEHESNPYLRAVLNVAIAFHSLKSYVNVNVSQTAGRGGVVVKGKNKVRRHHQTMDQCTLKRKKGSY